MSERETQILKTEKWNGQRDAFEKDHHLHLKSFLALKEFNKKQITYLTPPNKSPLP